ncbi:hypothetical protein QWJ41_14855 [Nocardioides sp. SOB44]|uniref:Uncharacterized protein n=1 Tax=Nocardioides cremeus TaxID=3058044 RepID=A0ABT8TUH2_9ACTN|nr:hypothetical protein [Nocardioides cremeus]MDO3397004.1 hypothetical protein [Nocardioides cremeus]
MTSKTPWNREREPQRTDASGKAVDESGRPARSAFGREITWTDIDEAMKPRPGHVLDEALAGGTSPTEQDFRDVGLSESDAKAAATGLSGGRFLSFEDACLSTAIFGPSKAVGLDETKMRERARRFATITGA